MTAASKVAAPLPGEATTGDAEPASAESQRQEALAEARHLLRMGVGVGAYGLVSAAVLGAACPVCVVAAPAFLGFGLYKRYRANRAGP